MIARRGVLLSLLGGVCATVGWRLLHGSAEEAIVAILHKRLDYLQLDGGGVQAFAGDLCAAGVVDEGKLRLMAASGPLYSHLLPESDHFLIASLRHGEERIVSLYLLSSDFFINGADETCPVHYLGRYDPARRACSNPFARLS